MLFLSLLAGVSFAALQTDFANVYYCPEGYCLRSKQTKSGFVGPQASFLECANADGEAKKIGYWNYYTSQGKKLDWSNKWSSSDKDWPSTLSVSGVTYKPVGKCCVMGGKKHSSWQCSSYMTVGSSSSKGCCYAYGMGWNGKQYAECCQKLDSSHNNNWSSMVSQGSCNVSKKSGGGTKFVSGKSCAQLKSSGWGTKSDQCAEGMIWKTCASPCEPYCGQDKSQMCMTVCKQACACPKGKVASYKGSKKCIDPQECKTDGTPSPTSQPKTYNCYTKETWKSDKKAWCCKNKKLGCSYNCYTRETWTQNKKEWCCKNKKLGCPRPTMAPTQKTTEDSKCSKYRKKNKCGKADGCMWNGKCVTDDCDNKCCKAKKKKDCKKMKGECIFKSKKCVVFEKPTKEQCAAKKSKGDCKSIGCKYNKKAGCRLP